MADTQVQGPPTLGQARVRHSFNPSGSYDVDNVKGRCADLIDLLQDFQKSNGGENARCFALAMTAIEEATMWAVKGLTGAPAKSE